jgi:hypothetical protein
VQFLDRLYAVASERSISTVPSKLEGIFGFRFREHVRAEGVSYEGQLSDGWDLPVSVGERAGVPGGFVTIGKTTRLLSFGDGSGDCLAPGQIGSRLEREGWKRAGPGASHFPLVHAWDNGAAHLDARVLVVEQRECVTSMTILFAH